MNLFRFSHESSSCPLDEYLTCDCSVDGILIVHHKSKCPRREVDALNVQTLVSYGIRSTAWSAPEYTPPDYSTELTLAVADLHLQHTHYSYSRINSWQAVIDILCLLNDEAKVVRALRSWLAEDLFSEPIETFIRYVEKLETYQDIPAVWAANILQEPSQSKDLMRRLENIFTQRLLEKTARVREFLKV